MEKDKKKLIEKFLKSKIKYNIIRKFQNKEVYLIKSKKKKYILKIYLDSFSKLLSEKEFYGYKLLKKTKIFNIPRLYFFKRGAKCNYLLLDYINGQKKSILYFSFFKFYNFLNKKKFKTTNVNQYFDKNIIFKEKKFLKQKFLFIKKYKNQKVKKNFSHGDFVHYNVLEYGNKFYTFDFEFFSKNRNYLFDFFNWFTVPIFHSIIRLNIHFFFSLLINLKLALLFIILRKNNIIKDRNLFDFYYNLFLLEKLYLLNFVSLNVNLDKHNKKLNKQVSKLINFLIYKRL